MPFFGENFTAADMTSLIAGRDIRSNIFGDAQPATIELAGPGTLDVQAGRDLDFQSQRVTGSVIRNRYPHHRQFDRRRRQSLR